MTGNAPEAETGRQYLSAAAVGGAVGAALGFAGANGAAMETGSPTGWATTLPTMAVCSVTGVVAGILYRRLQPLRSRGRAGYYGAWAIAVGLAFAIMVLPETLVTMFVGVVFTLLPTVRLAELPM